MSPICVRGACSDTAPQVRASYAEATTSRTSTLSIVTVGGVPWRTCSAACLASVSASKITKDPMGSARLGHLPSLTANRGLSPVSFQRWLRRYYRQMLNA